MEYKTKISGGGGIILEKYTEPKGFFRNTTGSLKVGMIRLDDGTEEMLIHDFLFEDGYYDVISAFQKSIRGSDVNAALHYAARLIEAEDLDILYLLHTNETDEPFLYNLTA